MLIVVLFATIKRFIRCIAFFLSCKYKVRTALQPILCSTHYGQQGSETRNINNYLPISQSSLPYFGSLTLWGLAVKFAATNSIGSLTLNVNFSFQIWTAGDMLLPLLIQYFNMPARGRLPIGRSEKTLRTALQPMFRGAWAA